MSLFDDAVASFLATANNHSDPLTASMVEQCTMPGPDAAPPVRQGWEDEDVDVPSNWRFLLVCALCALFVSVLAGGCSTLPQPLASDAEVPSAVQAACPPVAPTTRTDAHALALHSAQVHAWHVQCAQAVAAMLSGRSDLALACATPVAPVAGQAQIEAARYAACRAALWHNPVRPPVGGMLWPLAPQWGQS